MHRLSKLSVVRRQGRILAAIASLAVFAGGASAATTSNWSNATSGNWNTPANWSSNPNYPNNGTPAGSTYNVNLAVSGSAYTVTLDGDVAVSNLTINSAAATLSQTNGTLSLTGNLAIQSGAYLLGDATISGGRLTTVGSSVLTVTPTMFWTPATLNNTTVAGNVLVQNSARLVSSTDLTLDAGTIKLLSGSTLELDGAITGSGQVVFDSSSGSGIVTPSSLALTINPQITIRTGAGSGIVGQVQLSTTNNGLISAQTAGQTLTIQGDFINQGTLQAINGGTLTLNPGMVWSNTGTLRVDNGTLNIGGSDTLKNLGSFTRTAGTVNLTGGYFIEGPAALDLSNTAAGAVNLGSSAYVTNGSLTASTGLIQVVNSAGSGAFATLDRIQLQQDLVVNDSASLALVHDVTLNSTQISLASTGSSTRLRASQQTYLAGTGQITFDGSAAADNLVDGYLELRQGITLRTGSQGGTVGGVHGFIRNKGVVSAQTPGKTITIAGAFQNDGTVEARNGAAVVFAMAVNAANFDGAKLTGGTWNVYDGSTLEMGSAAIQVNAANVLLSGKTSTFAAIDSIQQNTGSFTVNGGRAFKTAGALDNSGQLTIGRDSVVFVNGALTNTGAADVSGHLIVQASDSTRDSALVQIANQIKSARNTSPDLWRGVGVGSSAARDDGRGMTGLGVILNDGGTPGSPAPIHTTFAGQDVNANCILVKYTWNGDANLDGVVNADDYFLTDSGYVSQKGGWHNGDFNYDSTVNADDYFLIDSAYIGQIGTLSGRIAAVPEPGMLGALGLGMMLLAGRVRRGTRTR